MKNFALLLPAIIFSGNCFAQEYSPVDTTDLISALQKGKISVNIAPDKNSIRLVIQREKQDKKDDIKICIPSGQLKIGFTGGRKISSRNNGFRRITRFADKEITSELEFRSNITTDDFNTDGFYLDLKDENIINMPKNKLSIDNLIKGSLKICVPNGYSGFPLNDLSGTIISGDISVKKINPSIFEINFGSLKVSK